MIDLVLGLGISIGIGLIGKRHISPTVPAIRVNAALGGAVLTVLLFYLLASWRGFLLASTAGGLAVLFVAGMMWRMIRKEQTAPMSNEEPPAQDISWSRAKMDKVLDERSEPPGFPVEAHAVTPPEREEFAAVRYAEEPVMPKETPANQEAEAEFYSLLPFGAMDADAVPAEREESLLLSDLSSLFGSDERDRHHIETEDPPREHKLVNDNLRSVLHLEEWFGDPPVGKSAAEAERPFYTSPLLELDEIKVGEDEFAQLDDTRKSTKSVSVPDGGNHNHRVDQRAGTSD